MKTSRKHKLVVRADGVDGLDSPRLNSEFEMGAGDHLCINCGKVYPESEFYSHSTGKKPALSQHSGHFFIINDGNQHATFVKVG